MKTASSFLMQCLSNKVFVRLSFVNEHKVGSSKTTLSKEIQPHILIPAFALIIECKSHNLSVIKI
jgi:hypothetical protein